MREPGVIRVRNLAKAFPLYAKRSDILREFVFRGAYHRDFWALRDVSFEVGKGRVVGVIGRNGAGKSTLLRILAGTLDKTSGDVEVDGRISAILELGSGFNPGFTGRQNVRMGCLVQGMSDGEIERKMDWIIDFSELRDVIDQPFRTYSSGMQTRLTFAVAISVDPDILIIDEALAAGDAFFVNKSLGRIRQICRSGSTVLFVSHSTNLVAQLCDEAIWLDAGRVRLAGESLSVVREYDYEVHRSMNDGSGSATTFDSIATGETDATSSPAVTMENVCRLPDTRRVFRRGPVVIERIDFVDESGESTMTFRRWGKMIVRVRYRCDGAIPEQSLGLAIAFNRGGDHLPISQVSTANVREDGELRTYHEAAFRKRPGRRGEIEGMIDPIQLAEGHYTVSVGILPNQNGVVAFYEYHHYRYDIAVLRSGYPIAGLVYYPMLTWRHRPDGEAEGS